MATPATWLICVQRRRQRESGKAKGARKGVLPEEPQAEAQEDVGDSDGYGEEGLSWEAVLATVQVQFLCV